MIARSSAYRIIWVRLHIIISPAAASIITASNVMLNNDERASPCLTPDFIDISPVGPSVIIILAR